MPRRGRRLRGVRAARIRAFLLYYGRSEAESRREKTCGAECGDRVATLASWVYHSFFFIPFEPIRIGVVDAEQTASRHVVAIALPDVSSLRGQAAVLAWRLRNGGPEPKRIGLLRDGLQRHRVVLTPDSDTSWNIVLTPDEVWALDCGGGRCGAIPRAHGRRGRVVGHVRRDPKLSPALGRPAECGRASHEHRRVPSVAVDIRILPARRSAVRARRAVTRRLRSSDCRRSFGNRPRW